MADERDEIRRRVDIVELVGQFVNLKRTGKSYTGLCPFHNDKRPSFTVNPDIGLYKCWSCGASGDIFNWVMETQKVDFREALEILAKEAGVMLSSRGAPSKEQNDLADRQRNAMDSALAFFKEQFASSPIAKDYAANRSMDQEVLQTWEIGYGPDLGDALARVLQKQKFSLAECKDLFLVDQDAGGGFYDRFRSRLIFPIRDERGRLVAFGGRIIGDGIPKYINSSDTPLYRKSRVLYGFYQSRDAISKDRHAVLTEGYMDTIACHRAGVGVAVANLGTALAEEQIQLLRRWCDRVTILYDSDAAGQKAADRSAALLEEAGIQVRIAVLPDGEDPDTVLQKSGPAGVQRGIEQAMTPIEFRVTMLADKLSLESDQFWQEIIPVLANANPLDIEPQILKIAQKYPHSRDKEKAAIAIRQLIKDYQSGKQALSTGQDNNKAINASRPRIPKLAGTEKVLFMALFDQAFAQQAWKLIQDDDNFSTTVGLKMAKALREEMGEEFPFTESNIWLPDIESEPLRRALSDLAFNSFEIINTHVMVALENKLEGIRARRQKERLEKDDSNLSDFWSEFKKNKKIIERERS
ncbi:MAG: DNA primase [Armatimonadetes bacterium]|nr:DNA primase [Armatimonadota bacterium]